MNKKIQISNKIANEAMRMGKVENRSLEGQIKHWVKIGKVVEANPELPYKLIREIQTGLIEIENGRFCEYRFG